MKERFLSIVTINKNDSLGLARTINSVLNQTFQDFWFSIIDGGSTDGSLELIESYVDRLDYFVSESDTGIYCAMNKGTRSVPHSKYILYLNSGDYLVNESTLEYVASFIKAQPPRKDLIIYGHTIVRSDDDSGPHFELSVSKEIKSVVHKMPMYHQSTFFPTQLMLENPYNESLMLSGDYALLARLYSKGIHFARLGLPISIFDRSGSSFLKRFNKLPYKELFVIKRSILMRSYGIILFELLYLYAINFLRTFAGAYSYVLSFGSYLKSALYRAKLVINKFYKTLIVSPSACLIFHVYMSEEHKAVLRFLRNSNIRAVFDVGSNRGQFYLACLKYLELKDYTGFDPLSSAVSKHNHVISRENVDMHRVFKTVISDGCKELEFFVTKKSDCSSYYRPSYGSDFYGAPHREVYSFKVQSKTLDAYIDNLSQWDSLIKIDVQGSELDVLIGAKNIIKSENTKFVYLEISEVEHYANQAHFTEIHRYLTAHSFELFQVFNTSYTKQGALLYADALYKRVPF